MPSSTRPPRAAPARELANRGSASAISYDAFISYSHRADLDLASALQDGLKKLAKPFWRLPLIRVYRDRTNLSASPGVWSSIEIALAQSRWFILMASPLAAVSPWVQREVGWWLQNRSSARLLVAVTDGDLLWDGQTQAFDRERSTCLPPALHTGFEEEPNWVDLRWARSSTQLSLRHARFRAAILDLAAPLHGRPKEELDSADIKQYRTARAASAAAITSIALLAGGASYAAWLARSNQTLAVSRQYAAEAIVALREGRLRGAMEAGLTAWQGAPTQEARSALLETWLAAREIEHVVVGFDAIQALHLAPGGETVRIWQASGRLTVWDLRRRIRVYDRPVSTPVAATSARFSHDGSQLAIGDAGGTITLIDTAQGRVLHRLPAPESGPVLALAFGLEGGQLAAGYSSSPSLQLWDVYSGRSSRVQPKLDDVPMEDSYVRGVAIDPGGRWLAAASGMPGSSAVVWSLRDGRMVSSFASSGRQVQHSSLAAISGDGAPLLALGWSNGETSVRQWPAEASTVRSPASHDNRVSGFAMASGELLSIGDDGVLKGSSAWPSWSREPLQAVASDAQTRRVAVGATDGSLVVYKLQDMAGVEGSDAAQVEHLSGHRLWLQRQLDAGSVQIDLLDGQGRPLAQARRGTLQAITGKTPWRAMVNRERELWLIDPTAAEPAWRQALPAMPGNLFELVAAGPGRLFAKRHPQSMLLQLPADGGATPLNLSPSAGLKGAPDGSALLVKDGNELKLWSLPAAVPLGDSLILPTLPRRDKDDDEDDDGPVHRWAWSPDSRWVLVGVSGGEARLYRRTPQGLQAVGTPLLRPRFSADGRWLLAALHPHGFEVIELATQTMVYRDTANSPLRATFSARGDRLLLEVDGAALAVLDLSRRPATRRTVLPSGVLDADFSPDGRWIVASTDAGLHLLAASGDTPWQIPQVQRPWSFSADGRQLAVTAGGAPVLIDLRARSLRRPGPSLARPLSDMAHGPDNALLVTIDLDGNYVVWDAMNGRSVGPVVRGPGEDEDLSHKVPSAKELPLHPQAWIDSLCLRLASARDDAGTSWPHSITTQCGALLRIPSLPG